MWTVLENELGETPMLSALTEAAVKSNVLEVLLHQLLQTFR